MTHRDQILPPTALHVMNALRNAQKLIEQGHCKGGAHVDDSWDAMGALAAVCSTVRIGNHVIPGKAIFDAAVAALKIAMSPRWKSVSEFSDGSSQDAVVALFMRAVGIVGRAVA